MCCSVPPGTAELARAPEHRGGSQWCRGRPGHAPPVADAGGTAAKMARAGTRGGRLARQQSSSRYSKARNPSANSVRGSRQRNYPSRSSRRADAGGSRDSPPSSSRGRSPLPADDAATRPFATASGEQPARPRQHTVFAAAAGRLARCPASNQPRRVNMPSSSRRPATSNCAWRGRRRTPPPRGPSALSIRPATRCAAPL